MFAFRLHQFLSKGDNVYVTLEPPGDPARHQHLPGRRARPDSDPDAPQRILVPTAFCRECGQEYLAVTRSDTDGGRRYAARRDNDASGGDEASGYLFISDDQPWPASLEQVLVDGRLPYSWLTYDPVAGQTVDPARAKLLPEPVQVDVTGREAGPGEGTYAAYVPSPFRFCLRCRTSYEQARGSDFAKLAKLSAEGRSSAMSLITASIVRDAAHLGRRPRRQGPQAARVRRQPPGRLACRPGTSTTSSRSPSCAAPCTGRWSKAPDGLTDEIVAQRVTEELGLAMADFARNPGAKYSQRDEAWRALREVTGYRLYLDLERGWRVTMPNLEQTGLLRIRYRDLPEVAADAEAWQGSHVALREDDPEHRRGDRRRAARRAAPQPGHRRRVPQRRRVRPGPAAVRAAPEGAVVAARARAPADGGRRLPRARQARPAAQQRVPVRPRPVRPVPDPRVRQPARSP